MFVIPFFLIVMTFMCNAANCPPWLKTVCKISPKPVVSVVFTNAGQLHFALNMFCSLKKLGLESKFVFAALDPLSTRILEELNIPYFRDPTFNTSSSTFELYGKEGYKKIMCTKVGITRHLAELGYNVIGFDADIAFRRIPQFDDLDYHQSDFILSSDQHPGAEKTTKYCYNNEHVVSNEACQDFCAGMYYVASKQKTISILRRAERVCPYSNTDQESLHAAFRHFKPSFKCFNPCMYANGYTWMWEGLSANHSDKAVMVHANFHIGTGKQGVFEKTGMWHKKCLYPKLALYIDELENHIIWHRQAPGEMRKEVLEYMRTHKTV